MEPVLKLPNVFGWCKGGKWRGGAYIMGNTRYNMQLRFQSLSCWSGSRSAVSLGVGPPRSSVSMLRCHLANSQIAIHTIRKMWTGMLNKLKTYMCMCGSSRRESCLSEIIVRADNTQRCWHTTNCDMLLVVCNQLHIVSKLRYLSQDRGSLILISPLPRTR